MWNDTNSKFNVIFLSCFSTFSWCDSWTVNSWMNIPSGTQRCLVIGVACRGVSFIFSSHSWSADIHTNTFRKTSSWRLLTPSSITSTTLNDVIWPRLAPLRGAELDSTPVDVKLKRGFKYLAAAVNNSRRIYSGRARFFSHSVSADGSGN